MSDYCYLAFVTDRDAGEDMCILKIGHSGDPLKRYYELDSMAWHGPSHMDIAYIPGRAMRLELYLHHVLRKHRNHGEWFWCPKTELEDALDKANVEFAVKFDLRIEGGEWA